MAVGRNVKRFVATVKKFDDVRRGRAVHYSRGDNLIHSLMVGGMGRIVHQTCAADIDGTGEEGHAQGLLMRNALQGPDEVRPLKILDMNISKSDGSFQKNRDLRTLDSCVH